MITATSLTFPGIKHGFFTRQGGHSKGLFSSLNCGLGSGDDVAVVTQNRAQVAATMGVAQAHLVSTYQVHSANVVVVDAPFSERPKVDGMVTATVGMALGVLTADCGSVLFADENAGVIGACHAGWKGALAGVTDTVIVAMEKLGAKRANIAAVVGPTISQAAYEVGPEFSKAFIDSEMSNQKYFISSVKSHHYMFDLPRYLVDRLRAFGVGEAQDLALCTYEDEEWFFSYRRATHRKEKDYGRLISTIVLRDD